MLAVFAAAPCMRRIPPCGSALAAAELKQRAVGVARRLSSECDGNLAARQLTGVCLPIGDARRTIADTMAFTRRMALGGEVIRRERGQPSLDTA